MSKFSNKEKRILSFIITNCEIYRLNEKDALKYIQDKLCRLISRRTYYNYKNQVYKNHEKNSPSFELTNLLDSHMRRDLTSLSLLSEKNNMIVEGLKENIKLEEFDGLNNFPKYLEGLQARAETMVDSTQKLANRLASEKQLVNKNYGQIPQNSTVREEFIKCGKDFCYRCPHGPYYYAYWKDENGTLRKKYIGRYIPKEITNKKTIDKSS